MLHGERHHTGRRAGSIVQSKRRVAEGQAEEQEKVSREASRERLTNRVHAARRKARLR